MGFAPPPNLPPPPALSVALSTPDLPSPPAPPAALLALLQQQFALSPPAIALCGFALPLPGYVFGLKLPSPIPFPPPIPKLKLAIGLNCALNNPLDVSAGVDFGGGKVANADLDPDLAF